jgi:hypothetical protein
MPRRSPSTRIGALALTLLLQVFVGSALLHPCCLDSDAEGGHGTVVSVADAHHGGHDGGSAPMHGAHADAGPASGAHGSGHAGHGGHDDAGDSGCEGLCGFCCQTAGLTGIPAPPVATAAADHASLPLVRPVPVAIRGSDTAHLLPWANAPPALRSTSV